MDESSCSLESFHLDEGLDGSLGDVTGTPLNCPFDDVSILNNSANSHGLINVSKLPSGLNIANARSLMSINNFRKNSRMPLWVVCDEEDERETMLMCTYKNNGYLVTGWASKTSPVNEPDPNHFFSLHEKLFSSESCKVNWKIDSVFRFEKTNQISGSDYDCNLKVSWDHHMVFYPPSSNFLNITLVTKCTPGKGGEPFRFIWEQILVLNQYYSWLCCEGQCSVTSIPVNEYIMSCLPKSYVTPPTKMADLLIEPIRLLESQSATQANTELLTDLISNVSSPEYSKLDALGKLWYLLLGCTSLNEIALRMTQLSSFLASQVFTSHLDQIYSATNVNQLMNMPLRPVVEFGIEKLKREMILIFSKVGLTCNVSSLPKLQLLPIDEWIKMVPISLHWLAKNFCLLEQLAYTQIVLEIPRQLLHPLAANISLQLSKMADESQGIEGFTGRPLIFTSHTLLLSMFKNLRKTIPDEWLMTVTSTKNDMCIGESRFLVGIMQPFIHQSDRDLPNMDDTKDTIREEKVNRSLGSLWISSLHLAFHKCSH